MNILLLAIFNLILLSSCISLVLSSLFKCSKCQLHLWDFVPFFFLVPIFSIMFILFPLGLIIKNKSLC